MTWTVRRAGPLDAAPMAELLNEIIARGGTTAITRPVTADGLRTHMTGQTPSTWHLAEDAAGLVLGFQWVEGHARLGPGASDIASFVRVGRSGQGVASALFKATCAAARDLGFTWINAEIRADNAGGLAYYQSRGFERYGAIIGKRLEDGTVVDKVLMRFDL